MDASWIVVLRERHHRRRTWGYPLALYLVALNAADWVLTYLALTDHEMWEINLIVGPFITSPVGFAMKILVPALIGWRLYRISWGDRATFRILIGACVFYTFVVAWNAYALYVLW